MRQFLFTLLTLCLLAGNAFTGISPVKMAHAQATAIAVDQAADCEHHQPRQSSGHGKPECCIAAHCPMLGQGMPPVAADSDLTLSGLVLEPVMSTIRSGIANPPSLRPPRSIA